MQPATSGTTKVDSALVNLRARGLEVHARLQELRDMACMMRDGVGDGRSASWAHFLDKYDTLSKLYMQLTDELDRALTDAGLQSLVALPRALTDVPTELPELLRTKLDQDVERELQEHEKTAFEEKQAVKNVAPVQMRVTAFNDFVDNALDQYQDLREKLATPRPPDIQRPPTPTSASIVLAAITNGTGLRE